MESVPPSLLEQARKQVEESCAVQRKISPELLSSLCSLAQRTAESLRAGRQILFCGNGGSAADAQHLAAEFVGRFLLERRPLPAQALAANTSALTAIANDFGFESVFSRQVEAFGSPGDILIAISTSGNSPNILRAAESARRIGLYTAGLTGAGGGLLKDCVDLLLAVPSSETQRIQEAHILLGHIYCSLVESLFVKGNS
jgi:D-sedoheptulose 7-phosphate isomerase